MPKMLPGYSGSVRPDSLAPLPIKTSINARPDQQSSGGSTNYFRERLLAAQQAAAAQRAKSVEPPSFLPLKRTTDPTAYTEMTRAGYIQSAKDVCPKYKPCEIAVTEATKGVHFASRSVQHEQSLGFVHEPEDATGFYSKVRKAEQVDDNVRFSENHITTRSSAAKYVRNVAIKSRREQDEQFVPPKAEIDRVLPTKRSTWTGASSGTSDACVVVTPPSSYMHDFHSPAELSQVAAHTLEATLPKASRAIAIDQSLVTTSATQDLFSGTAKVCPNIASGFMGHVPATAANASHLHGPNDMLRQHAKSHVNITTGQHLAHMQRLATSSPQRRGQTVTGFYLEQAAASKEEACMNRVEHGRQNAVRGFFSAGVGQADPVIADQFCVRYRPLEGFMKMGPASTHSWISDKELRMRRM